MSIQQNDTEAQLQQLEPQPIVSIRAVDPVEQLGQAMGDRIQALSGYMREHNLQPAGPPFVRYHTFGETETDFEFGVPIAEPATGEGRVASGELPGGPAVTTWHYGAHDKLGEAYARIQAWQQEHGREANGPGWEVYHWLDLSVEQDPSTIDPTTWGTQLVQPVK